MTENDWFEIDRANGRFEGAWADLRAAYVNQIKRLEKQLEEANGLLKQIADTRNFQYGHKFAQSYLKKWGIK